MNARFALSALGVAALGVACASKDGVDARSNGSTEQSAATAEAVSSVNNERSVTTAVAPKYYWLERDHRICPPPQCKRFWVHEVNTGSPPVYVWALDYSKSNLDSATIALAATAPTDEIILRGYVRTNDPVAWFEVTDAYRGMPGIDLDGETFFQVTVRGDNDDNYSWCSTLVAHELNTRGREAFGSLDLTRVDHRVQSSWLTARLENRNAIALGRFRNDDVYGHGNRVLDVTQVFLRLPETVGPCPTAIPTPVCGEDEVLTMYRNADRCFVPTGCARRAKHCPQMPIGCDADYDIVSWAMTGTGCMTFVCDPTWSDGAGSRAFVGSARLVQ